MLLFTMLLLAATPAPTPTDTISVLSGELDPRVIQRGVKRHMNAIQDCYQHELDRSPSLEGDLTVRFQISPDGRAHDAEIARSTLDDATVEQCVTGVFDQMTFARPPGPVTVTFPLRFSTDR